MCSRADFVLYVLFCCTQALENFTGRDCVEDQPENSSNFVPGEDSDSENEEEYSEADEDTSDDEWIDETEMAAAEALGDVNDSDDDKQLKELAMDSDSDNEAVSKYDSDEDKEGVCLEVLGHLFFTFSCLFV